MSGLRRARFRKNLREVMTRKEIMNSSRTTCSTDKYKELTYLALGTFGSDPPRLDHAHEVSVGFDLASSRDRRH